MRRTWRWILGVLVAIVLLAVLVLWLLLRGSLAELDGERPLPGLATKVTVERDALGWSPSPPATRLMPCGRSAVFTRRNVISKWT